MKYEIDCTLYAGVSGSVDLGDKAWSDVKEWYVKWDTLNVLFNGDSEYTKIDLNSKLKDAEFDWKRPTSVSVFAVGEDGSVDYGKEVAEG